MDKQAGRLFDRLRGRLGRAAPPAPFLRYQPVQPPPAPKPPPVPVQPEVKAPKAPTVLPSFTAAPKPYRVPAPIYHPPQPTAEQQAPNPVFAKMDEMGEAPGDKQQAAPYHPGSLEASRDQHWEDNQKKMREQDLLDSILGKQRRKEAGMSEANQEDLQKLAWGRWGRGNGPIRQLFRNIAARRSAPALRSAPIYRAAPAAAPKPVAAPTPRLPLPSAPEAVPAEPKRTPLRSPVLEPTPAFGRMEAPAAAPEDLSPIQRMMRGDAQQALARQAQAVELPLTLGPAGPSKAGPPPKAPSSVVPSAAAFVRGALRGVDEATDAGLAAVENGKPAQSWEDWAANQDSRQEEADGPIDFGGKDEPAPAKKKTNEKYYANKANEADKVRLRGNINTGTSGGNAAAAGKGTIKSGPFAGRDPIAEAQSRPGGINAGPSVAGGHSPAMQERRLRLLQEAAKAAQPPRPFVGIPSSASVRSRDFKLSEPDLEPQESPSKRPPIPELSSLGGSGAGKIAADLRSGLQQAAYLLRKLGNLDPAVPAEPKLDGGPAEQSKGKGAIESLAAPKGYTGMETAAPEGNAQQSGPLGLVSAPAQPVTPQTAMGGSAPAPALGTAPAGSVPLPSQRPMPARTPEGATSLKRAGYQGDVQVPTWGVMGF